MLSTSLPPFPSLLGAIPFSLPSDIGTNPWEKIGTQKLIGYNQAWQRGFSAEVEQVFCRF
jgi:hypothetical protein